MFGLTGPSFRLAVTERVQPDFSFLRSNPQMDTYFDPAFGRAGVILRGCRPQRTKEHAASRSRPVLVQPPAPFERNRIAAAPDHRGSGRTGNRRRARVGSFLRLARGRRVAGTKSLDSFAFSLISFASVSDYRFHRDQDWTPRDPVGHHSGVSTTVAGRQRATPLTRTPEPRAELAARSACRDSSARRAPKISSLALGSCPRQKRSSEVRLTRANRGPPLPLGQHELILPSRAAGLVNYVSASGQTASEKAEEVVKEMLQAGQATVPCLATAKRKSDCRPCLGRRSSGIARRQDGDRHRSRD